ncbi:ATP-dependent helicase HrpB [Nocardioides sp. GXZ039]|uniref:ATP-dependent helicase HrpB n=1 Tax=Nocardioides sp. GXZ039 TaxID=3136018 RepID=UPI0030F45662
MAAPPALPVAAGLGRITDAVQATGAVVVQAPPGSGKTTLVPPAIALTVAGGGRVVVTQPRRIAARAAARRLAALLGEPVGETVGYTVRGESRTGPSTRIEMVTPGVLLRRLQRDPDLPDVAAVVLDEVHERQLDADLVLALLVDVRRHLRDDLPLVAMSATVEAERTAALLDGAAVVTVPGALHPVARRWAPPPPGVLARDERGVTPAFLDHVATTTRRALAEETGDVLVFVPGVREIGAVTRRLSGIDADVVELHGRLDARAQDRALSPGTTRRVVVTTDVAESSLTVPGVRIVVDAGLARRPQTDHRRGLAGLVTVRVSKAAADQRAGRAGREGPGVVLRCWSEEEHSRLDEHPAPEIATADLAGFALELALWGAPDGAGLALLDSPPAPAMDAAHAVLTDLGALDDDHALTDRGRAIARVPADPRLARALLDGAASVGSKRAAEVVALLAEDLRAPDGDLVAALRRARRERDPGWRAAAQRFAGLIDDHPHGTPGSTGLTDDQAVGLIVALAHPDRIARLRPGGASYATVGGTGATLAPGAALTATTWLAVADAERRPGQRDATIRSAAPIDEATALETAAARWHEDDVVTWRAGRITARRVTRLGAIELASTPIADPDPAAVTAAIAEALRRDGLDTLRWTDAAVSLRRRLAFLHRTLGEPWPDVSDDALLGAADQWLVGTDPRRLDVAAALRRLLPWPEAARLDELAPEHVTVPSGSRVRIDYEPDVPVLAVRIQEVFGWDRAPRLAEGRVSLLLHLLSPARRPAAVTADLASFWASGYPQVRAELRGRYPKHAWPDDPLSATPTRGTGRSRR